MYNMKVAPFFLNIEIYISLTEKFRIEIMSFFIFKCLCTPKCHSNKQRWHVYVQLFMKSRCHLFMPMKDREKYIYEQVYKFIKLLFMCTSSNVNLQFANPSSSRLLPILQQWWEIQKSLSSLQSVSHGLG